MIDNNLKVLEEAFSKSRKRVYDAQDSLLSKLFGCVPTDPWTYTVSRESYIKAMHEVQDEYDLVEGDPDMVLFVLEQLSRSPRFIDEKKGGQLK